VQEVGLAAVLECWAPPFWPSVRKEGLQLVEILEAMALSDLDPVPLWLQGSEQGKIVGAAMDSVGKWEVLVETIKHNQLVLRLLPG
jgi:hypothetical protein